MNLELFRAEVDTVAQKYLGIGVYDIIGDDSDLQNAMDEGVHPIEFVKEKTEKYELTPSEPFPVKKKFRVNAEVITFCHIDVEAYDADEANDIADATDGGDFITGEGGDFVIQKSLTSEIEEGK